MNNKFGGSIHKYHFDTLWHRIYGANKEQLIWFGAVVIIMIVLAVLHHKWKDDSRKICLWRGLYFMPAVIAAVHALIYLRGFPLSQKSLQIKYEFSDFRD